MEFSAKSSPENLSDPAGKRALARQRGVIERQAVAARKREMHFRMRQREPPHRLGHGAGLGAVGAEEFQPRGRREEEVAHLDLRAGGMACRPRLADAAAVDLDRPAMLLSCAAAKR